MAYSEIYVIAAVVFALGGFAILMVKKIPAAGQAHLSKEDEALMEVG